MPRTAARNQLAGILGIDPRSLHESQISRFLQYEAECQLTVRADELKGAIEDRPEPQTNWQRFVLLFGDPTRERRHAEEWLQARLDGLPERLHQEQHRP